MDNLSGDVSGYLEAVTEKKKDENPIEHMAETKEMLDISDEIIGVEEILGSLKEKYQINSNKHLYDAITSIELGKYSLLKIN